MSENIVEKTGKAGANLSGKQYFAVKISASGAGTAANVPTVVLCGADEKPFGILLSEPESGQAALIQVSGEQTAISGGTISAGDRLTVDAAGKVISATNTTTIGISIGNALADAVTADRVKILIDKQ